MHSASDICILPRQDAYCLDGMHSASTGCILPRDECISPLYRCPGPGPGIDIEAICIHPEAVCIPSRQNASRRGSMHPVEAVCIYLRQNAYMYPFLNGYIRFCDPQGYHSITEISNNRIYDMTCIVANKGEGFRA